MVLNPRNAYAAAFAQQLIGKHLAQVAHPSLAAACQAPC